MPYLKIISLLILMSFPQKGQDWKEFRPEARQIEDVEEVMATASALYSNGSISAAKAYYYEVISRVSQDSTRCEMDFEARMMMAQIEESLGDLERSRKWLLSINTHSSSHPWVRYPEGWRQRLSQENQRNKQLSLKEQERKAQVTHLSIIAAVIVLLLLAMFIYLFISKTLAYKKLAEKATEWAHVTDKKDVESSNSEDGISQTAQRIREYMESSQCYLTPGLKLDDLVSALGSNRTYISRAANQLAPNFNALVNEYRIKESVRLLSEDSHITLDQVALDCGFNNRKSFNEAFKNYTGLTPSEFRHNR